MEVFLRTTPPDSPWQENSRRGGVRAIFAMRTNSIIVLGNCHPWEHNVRIPGSTTSVSVQSAASSSGQLPLRRSMRLIVALAGRPGRFVEATAVPNATQHESGTARMVTGVATLLSGILQIPRFWGGR